MEHNDKITKGEKIQIIFIILIAIAIASFIVAIIIIVKNIEEIKSDPIEYGIKKKGIETCSCFHEDGYYINYPGGKIVNPIK